MERKGGRAERLEAALRDNLRRRKAQARGRAVASSSDSQPAASPHDEGASPRDAEDGPEGT